ncbi:MAG: hypothetical protein R3B94_09185 [Hyphomonas sp.]
MKINIYSRLFMTLLAASLLVPASVFAQVAFSDRPSEITSLQASANECATTQGMTVCLNALSLAEMFRKRNAYSENSFESITLNAVELLPLHMLAQLYLRDADKSTACEYARRGETQIVEISEQSRRLSEQDPEAFQSIDNTLLQLDGLKTQFSEVQAYCPGT